ncbi:hypothetical protein [Pseudotamlana agarivorans]|uniref:hypothetical protein n=1 Tax=Pseudotamlana agarivorans TaxID=481183 RepID=UPI0008326587|nr:hypothetical protein [Tamlana agarivorans]
MNLKFLALFTLFITAVGCSSDDGNNHSNGETDMTLVTGLNLRSSEISPPYQVGNPNALIADQLIVYPNPTLGILNIKANSGISDVWIIPSQANKIYQQTDFSTILNSNLYDESKIASHAELEITDMTASRVIFDLKEIKFGYYKVFVKIDGKIYWENIYFQDNNTDIEDLINYWE